MAVSHRGAISFGMVHIPVALYTATQDNDVHFNQLHKEDNSRLKYKKVCSHCGEEVGSQDIVKGFEYDKGQFIIFTESDFEELKTEKDRTIHILHFTAIDNIRPMFFNKTYHIIPENGGDKAFELLRQAMLKENKVAVAKTVIGQTEKLLTILPTAKGMHIETMFYLDEIKDLPKEPQQPAIHDSELKMARQLVAAMDKPFEPEQYKNEYQARLRQRIEKKITTGQVTIPESEGSSAKIIDIQEALMASIQQLGNAAAGEQEKPKRTRKKSSAS